MLSQKKFEDLRTGDKFYPVTNGNINLKLQCIKVSEIRLTADIISRYDITKATLAHLAFNCVILESTNKVTGFFHFLHDSDLVSVEGMVC